MLNTESEVRVREELLATVSRLAADPSMQRDYLEQLGTWDCLDELALEFDWSYSTLKTYGLLTADQAEALESIDKLLVSFSGEANTPLWYGLEGLEKPEWAEVRILARNALATLQKGPNSLG
jgi:hypothetical protein